MSLENLFADFRATFAQKVGNPLAALGAMVARRGPTRRRSVVEPRSSPTARSTSTLADTAVAPAEELQAANAATDPGLSECRGPVEIRPVAIPSEPTALPPAAKAPPPVAEALSPPPACPAPVADAELEAIRDQIASMEARIVDLEAGKAEMEQLLDEYAFCQYRALGNLLGEHLRLQHEVLRRRAERSADPEDDRAATAAAEEYASYQQACAAPADQPPVLADGDRKELTALYRAAAMRCHPDRVGDAEKTRAHEMFLRTQKAYRCRDLEALRQISRELAGSAMPSPTPDVPTPREHLEAWLERLFDKGAELLLAIQSIKMQAQYRRAQHREDWDDHFAAMRQQLEGECRALQRELARG